MPVEVPWSNSSMGTKHLDGLRQPKSVSRTAKVRSFYGFRQPRWKSVRKTAKVRQFCWAQQCIRKTANSSMDTFKNCHICQDSPIV